MGSDESHFDVSLIVRDRVTRQWPQMTTFEEKGGPSNRGPSAYQLNAMLLCQTGSQLFIVVVDRFCIALFSTPEQTHCSLFACASKSVTIRLIRDGKRGEGRGGGMEVGEEGDYILYIATLSPPE